jgi:gamma-glutamyltranspeptidase/glutathione hydrolase
LVAGVPTCNSTIGSVQGAIIDLQTGKQYGGADQRREGTVIGLPRPQGK